MRRGDETGAHADAVGAGCAGTADSVAEGVAAGASKKAAGGSGSEP